MVVSTEVLWHFSKDMEIARTADAATDDHELSHEILFLCKGTVLDSGNVHRLWRTWQKGVDKLLPLSRSTGPSQDTF